MFQAIVSFRTVTLLLMMKEIQVKEVEITVPSFQQFGDGQKIEIIASRVLFFKIKVGRLCSHGRIPFGAIKPMAFVWQSH